MGLDFFATYKLSMADIGGVTIQQIRRLEEGFFSRLAKCISFPRPATDLLKV